MVKESKSAATIRRRRYWNPALREAVGRHKTPHGEDSLDSDESDVEFVQDEPVQGPPVIRLILSSQWTLYLGLLALRTINALVIQTAYVPDEYWQSVEVAHNIAFGYGHLTWEWRTGLRGYSYPAAIAVVYKVLGFLHLDYTILLTKLPRLLQAVLAATGDLYLYKLSYKLSGQRVAQWSLFCQLTSWFTFYCCTRTLTNSVETSLTTIALYYFPWPGRARKAHWKYVTLVGIAVVIRPTAAIVWVLLCMWHMSLWKNVSWKVLKLFAEKGFIILSLSSIIDRYFYGKWVYVHYNFLQFNVLSNLGTFYGWHPWHWYLSQGLWVVLGSHAAPFLLAVRRGMEPVFLAVITWTILMYSMLGHKEFRFLFPILPMAMHVCGVYLHHLTEGPTEQTASSEMEPGTDAATADTMSGTPKSERSKTSAWSHVKSAVRRALSAYQSLESAVAGFWRHKQYVIAALLLTNVPLALYTSVLHQRGTIDVMRHLSDEARRHVPGQAMGVMFLMPCHSTPYYGYLHQNVSMRFLTCEPNLDKVVNYTDEADVFYTDPTQWLKEELQRLKDGQRAFVGDRLPSHLVMFSGLAPQIEGFLGHQGYQECIRFFHTHVPDGRVGSHVVVMCQRPWFRSSRVLSSDTLPPEFRL